MNKKVNENRTTTKVKRATRKNNNKEQVVTVAIERDAKETCFKLTIPNPERKRNKGEDGDKPNQEATNREPELASTAS